MANDIADNFVDNAIRTITVVINNSSDGDLGVVSGTLTGGNWVGPPPIPNQVLSAGQSSFVDGGDNVFTSLGGEIDLVPASGGSISIKWNWPRGSGVSGTTTGNSLNGLAVSSTVINTQSNSPQMQVYITDAQALTKALEQAGVISR